MIIDDLMKKRLPCVPEKNQRAISSSVITPTGFDEKNAILESEALQQEIGVVKMNDGNYLVSMVCPMPGITAEMINWWFWWHPQAGERYKVWFPGEHFGIGFSKKQKDYFAGAVCPEFQPNTHFPLEKIGKVVLPLRIDFVNAEQLGFSLDLMTEKEIPVIVAGHVGAFGGIVMHTEMAHIFKRTDDGLVLISRFWLGKTMKSKLLKKLIITEKMAEDMARHCCVEYRNLVEILPALYGEYGK